MKFSVVKSCKKDFVEEDHDQAQKKLLSLDWPRERRNRKLFITNLKIIRFLPGFIYAIGITAACHQTPYVQPLNHKWNSKEELVAASKQLSSTFFIISEAAAVLFRGSFREIFFKELRYCGCNRQKNPGRRK